MSNKHAEQLCAMMDGELGQSETRFLLKRLGHEQQLIARWKRYHYSRAVLRGDNLVQQTCLCERISVAIEKEPQPALEQISGNAIMPAWLRPVAGFAVAASVAVAAFTMMQSGPITSLADQAVASATLDASKSLPSMGLRAQTASAGSGSYDPRVQSYVDRHNALAASRRGRDLGRYIYLITTPVKGTAKAAHSDTEAVSKAPLQTEKEVSE